MAGTYHTYSLDAHAVLSGKLKLTVVKKTRDRNGHVTLPLVPGVPFTSPPLPLTLPLYLYPIHSPMAKRQEIWVEVSLRPVTLVFRTGAYHLRVAGSFREPTR